MVGDFTKSIGLFIRYCNKLYNVVRQFMERWKRLKNMKKLLLLILLFSFKIYSQEILTKDEVFSKDSLVYKCIKFELFTGKYSF